MHNYESTMVHGRFIIVIIDEMYIVIMHQKLPRCQISCTLQRGLLTLWLTCTLVQPNMIPRKRITLSCSVTIIGFTHTVYSWLQSYLIGRYQSVHVDRQSFTPTLSTIGVPRGSVLGPLLFFYIYTYFPISSVPSMFSTVSTLMTPTPCRSLYLFLPPAIQLTY